MQDQMKPEKNFVDKARLQLKAGDGGSGCFTFYRDRKVVSGAPGH